MGDDADEFHVLDRTVRLPAVTVARMAVPAAASAPRRRRPRPRPRQLSFARPYAPPTTPGDAP